MRKPNAKIFVSYSYGDRQWVDQFLGSLQRSGVDAWASSEKLQPGDHWVMKIQEALRESSTLVVVFSGEGVRSPWTFFEIGAAVADKKRIIPVLIDDLEPTKLPELLAQFQAVRAKSPSEAAEKVANALKRRGRK